MPLLRSGILRDAVKSHHTSLASAYYGDDDDDGNFVATDLMTRPTTISSQRIAFFDD